MALKKTHSSKKMVFGEHRDLEQVVKAPIVSPGQLKRINVNVDEMKHMRFKAACAKNGTSIAEVVNELIDDWLQTHE